MSDSLWPHGLQSTRLLCPLNFPGKNTGCELPFPPLEDLPNPRINTAPLAPRALAVRFFTTAPRGEALSKRELLLLSSKCQLAFQA